MVAEQKCVEDGDGPYSRHTVEAQNSGFTTEEYKGTHRCLSGRVK